MIKSMKYSYECIMTLSILFIGKVNEMKEEGREKGKRKEGCCAA